ncbi:MAG TPA: HAMP domain-containing protein [Symbiobacteriaceae bacterium]|nr:HAMP domain-containing protein [Symbiobacteriaceae bacterium]
MRLRGLFLTAALALLLLPLVALGGGLLGMAALNGSVVPRSSAEIDTVQRNVVQYAASLWDLLPDHRDEFAGGLAGLGEGQPFALEIRSIQNKVLFKSPAVTDGEYRTALIEKDGAALGIAQVWIAPAATHNVRGKAMAAGLWTGTALLVVLLLGLVWLIGRSILRPLRALERATAAVAEGALDLPVPHSRVAELDTLTRGFISLRDRLQAALDRQQALESDQRRLGG